MRIALTAFLVLALSACAGRDTRDAALMPGALPADGPVSVRWTDPAQFDELRYSRGLNARSDGQWIEKLARHLQDRAAPRLEAGQTLDVTLTNIDRAGDYEPWRGPWYQHIRFMRDIYPPRMTLDFTLRDASGRVMAQGERKLSDIGFTLRGSAIDSDPLRYEKRMIDDWLRREFRDAGIAAR